MTKLTTVVGLFLFSISLMAQNMSDPLPVNQKIKKGVLENGMTYYLYSTDVTKDAASYYIIQNVGSILENDEQQGLAHFLEHMAFNGTKNFEGKGILNTLQVHGAVFGKDINAYTSFDETVYNVNNIPTTHALIDTCLLILHDWSNYLLLEEEEIDAERGVIKEEWRTRRSGRMRVFEQTLATYFNNAKYANRMPIGLMDIVDNFEYDALRDFYHDWYRTDLQAIAIVGDIDIEEMEKKIIALFSSIPAVEDSIERYTVQIADNEDMLYVLAMDDEVSTANISFAISHPRPLKDQTTADLKESLLDNMAINMLSARVKEETDKPDVSFLSARVQYGKFARAKNKFLINIVPKPNQQAQAFKEVMTIVERAVKFGFTQGEIDRTIVEINSLYENQINKINDLSHQNIISTIKNNYLENQTMTDVVKEYDLAKQIFAALNGTELDNTLKRMFASTNRSLIVTGIKGKNNLSEEEGLQIIKEVENDKNLKPYVDEFSGLTLMTGIDLKEGSIISEVYNKEIEAKTFTLSNGIKVHYKFTDKNNNNVQLKAQSYGGKSLINDKDLPSAGMVPGLISTSGIGDYNSTDINKIMAGKTANTSIGIGNITEYITGSSVTKDVETLLQLVYLRFAKPRFDQNAYDVLMSNVDNYKIRRSKNIGEKMKDSMTITVYGKDHPTKRIFNDEYTKSFSFEKMKAIYLDRFNNAADFEFFIIGDIPENDLKPLLKKYMASIPTNAVNETWEDNTASWINDNIDKDIFLEMENPKSSVRINYVNNMTFSLKNALLARTLAAMLKLRFTETLREEEGGTYGASVRSNVSKRPKEEVSLSVSFDCNPEKVEKLVSIVHREIKKIENGDVQQLDLDKTLTNYLKERKQQQDQNSYEMSLLTNFYLEGYNMNDPENFEEIVNSITIKDIQEFTKKTLKNARTFEIVFKPEK